MAKKYLDYSGLSYFWSKIKAWVQNYAKVTSSGGNSTITIGDASLTPVLKDGDKVLSDNNFTDADKTKLDGISSGAEVNQNAFNTVKIGSTNITADSKTDTLEIASSTGNVISIAGDSTNDKITFSVDTDLSKYDNTTSKFITLEEVPEGVAASNTTPLMDGVASVGTESAYARGDHKHPSDTSKANASELIISDGATADKKTIQLKTGVSQEVLIAHQDISDLATKATTLAGYGITDANITNGVITLGSNTITPVTDVSNLVPKTTKVNGHALSSNVTVTKGDVGLSNVTNDAQVPLSQVGAANGVCPLNANVKIDSTYLPSYVDDVVEGYARPGQEALSSTWLATGSATGTVITPEAGVIYVLMADSGDYAANSQFRWGGTEYVKLNDGGVSSITNAEIDTITAA